MLGSLSLLQHLIDRNNVDCSPGAQGPAQNLHLHIPLMTDNQGNALAILNSNSKKWPTSAILMELVMQAHINQVALGPMHIKRSRNKWADRLAGDNYAGFDHSKRVPAFMLSKWRILGQTIGLFYHNICDKHPGLSQTP